jgi:hypothetical protein
MGAFRRFLLLSLLAVVCASAAAPAVAQKSGTKYFEDAVHGFKFKPLKDWKNIPLSDDLKRSRVIARFTAERRVSVKSPTNIILQAEVDLYVFRFDQPVATTGGSKGGLRDRVGSTATRPKIEEIIPRMFTYRDFKEEGMKNPEVPLEEKKLKKGLVARHATWWANAGEGHKVFLDAWTLHMDDYDICWLFILPDQRKNNKKWLKAFTSSAKSIQLIEKEAAMEAVGQDGSYAEQLAFHKDEAEKVEGWTAYGTPSEQYIIKTSSDDKKFVEGVIKRLESSRKVFERDFPPTTEMTHVSVVRVCRNREEFSRYGNTKQGVAGYFNPGSTELVLYDSKDRDRRETLAVMSHEAFHQYCYFLFGASEAHRWFDEGHGDYYGGYEFKGKKAIATAHMPGGLDRFQGIKTLVRENKYRPIFNHINYSHSQWQNQGPSNTSCYEQSWSIIYFLRQGTLGKVSKKVWKKEYANIIPTYIRLLDEGFSKAKAEIAKELEKDLASLKGEQDAEMRELIMARIANPPVGAGKKSEIWKAAMDASWGQIDIAEFEENWVDFVKDHMD